MMEKEKIERDDLGTKKVEKKIDFKGLAWEKPERNWRESKRDFYFFY